MCQLFMSNIFLHMNLLKTEDVFTTFIFTHATVISIYLRSHLKAIDQYLNLREDSCLEKPKLRLQNVVKTVKVALSFCYILSHDN